MARTGAAVSLSLLTSGRFRLRVRGYGSERGIATTFPAGTPLETVEAEQARRMAARGAAQIETANPTVANLADDYLATRAKRFSAKGLVRAAGIVREIQADLIGAVVAFELKSWHFDDWQERLDDRGDSDGTIDRKSNVLRSILRHAVRRGKIDTSPLRLGDLPRRVPGNRTTPVFFMPEQWQAFIRADVPERLAEWRPIWWALLLTGCRLGEILTLRWEQVDLKAGVILIEQAKTDFPKRTYIEPELRAVLESLPRGIGKALVFGERTSLQAQRAFAAYRDTAGLPRNLTPHKLRHTTASWAIQSGASLKVVQVMLGHRSIQTTMKYAHLGDEQVRAGLGMVGRIAGGAR